MIVDVDDDERGVALELLHGSFQQDSVKQQTLAPGGGEGVHHGLKTEQVLR